MHFRKRRDSVKEDPFCLGSLLKAADLCCKNVAWKESVSIWMNDKVKNCIQLEKELQDCTYRMLLPTVFHIKDPKPRAISAMKFRDRVVQRSLCENGLYDYLTKDLIYDNCACQKNKGITFAVERLKHHLHRYYNVNHTNNGYIIRLDIRKYFPSIPHELLKKEVSKRISDRKILEIVNYIIDEQVKVKCEEDLSFNDRSFGIRGIGLGSQLSQLFALSYLSDLDHYISEKLPHLVSGYIRYMDDMIMIARTKEDAEKAYRLIDVFVNGKGLKLNSKSKIRRLDQPIEFLKIIFTLKTSGKVTSRAVRKSINRELRNMNKKIKMFKENHISYFNLLQHTNTWFGYAIHRCGRNQIRFVRKHIHEEFEEFDKIRI